LGDKPFRGVVREVLLITENKVHYNRPLHRYAFVTAGCTFLLVLAGALVTSTGSSLSVPDWPLSFGQFFPPMVGGVLFEHGHRLVAGTVALMTVALAIFIQIYEIRRWVKILAWTSVGAVVVQAVLGGVTVLMHLPTAVSVAHAGLAQIFLCLNVSLALVTSKHWIWDQPARLYNQSLRNFVPWAVGLVYLQVLLGAIMRHSGAGLAIPDFPTCFGGILPPEWSFPILINYLHRLGALGVLTFLTWLTYQVCHGYPEEKSLFWPAACAGFLVWLQCLLGILVVVTQKDVVPTSFHVLTGAGVLASTLVLALNSLRLFRPVVRT
jgi:cytochrome c oxidase assembly protein subunit 15